MNSARKPSAVSRGKKAGAGARVDGGDNEVQSVDFRTPRKIVPLMPPTWPQVHQGGRQVPLQRNPEAVAFQTGEQAGNYE